MAAHGDELRADFQQFYSLNIDGMGDEYSVSHAAVLCEQLPKESRTMRSIAPHAGFEQILLSRIEYWAHWIAWSKTKDGKRNANRPKQVLPEHIEDDGHVSVSVDELDRIFKKEVNDGAGDSCCIREDISED